MAAFTGKVEGGAVLVPPALREALGLSDGDAVRMEVHGHELRIVSLRAIVRDVQDSLKHLAVPGRPLSDELIADRRAEAERE